MKSWLKISILICLLLRSLVLAIAEEKPQSAGIIHFHSTFSDGERPPNTILNPLAKGGFDFAVATDHVEQIPVRQKPIKTEYFTDDYGYDNYFETFTKDSPTISFAGIEKMVRGNSSYGHLLVFGEEDRLKSIVERLVECNMETAVELAGNGLFTIAAHPNCKDYPFDQNFREINGIEFFNDNQGYTLTKDWYFRILNEGRDVFVTGGCDSHISLEIPIPTTEAQQDRDRWQRKTILLANANRKDILQAFKEGKTYVACYNSALANLSYWPQFAWQDAETANISFDLIFTRPTSEGKNVCIYRDGKVVKTIQLPKGEKGYRIKFMDSECGIGKHWYVIEVQGLIITSPIRLDVKKATPAISQKSTGGMNLLLGKTRQEVESICGKASFIPVASQDIYLYRQWPAEHYEGNIYFAYGRDFHLDVRSNAKVHAVALRFLKPGKSVIYNPDKPEYNPYRGLVSAKEVLPSWLIKTRSYGTYRCLAKGLVVTLWYVDGNTIVLVRGPVSNKPIDDAKNMKDLTVGGVYYFGYIDRVIKPKEEKGLYSRQKHYSIHLDVPAFEGYSFYP